jgi:hypothetical protein
MLQPHKQTTKQSEEVKKTDSPTFLILFNNKVSAALFNYCKIRTLVSMVLSTIVTIVKQ